MFPTVMLTVMGGRYDGRHFWFRDAGVYVLGRASDCDVPIPSDPTYLTVSRHHCEIEIDLTNVRIRDHSLNGTYVNGRRLAEDVECELADGDEIWVGNMILRASVIASLEAPKPGVPDEALSVCV